MIITGLFLFLLGTKLGQAATNTEVKYEGQEKITVTEQKDDNIVLPGLGSPPFAPSFFHQGSNFFFNPHFMPPGEITPNGVERVIAPFQPPNYGNHINIAAPQVTSDLIIENEPIVEVIVPKLQSIAVPQFVQTIPQVHVEIDRQPIKIPVGLELPSFTLVPKPPVHDLVEEPSDNTFPCEDIEINNTIPDTPILMEESFKPSHGVFVSEVEVRIDEIPPPPELPPLIISEIPKPVVLQENKRVVLVPSPPELASFYPPVMLDEKRLIPMDCAQDIIFKRVLPHIAFEKGKMIELISIPATKRAPVLSSIIY